MTALYVLGALLVLLLAGVVLAPLLEREPPDEEIDDLPPDERRAAAVEALSEVEFEYRTDKLPEEEYRRLRTHYGRIALDAEEEMGASPGRRGEPGSAAGPGTSGPAVGDDEASATSPAGAAAGDPGREGGSRDARPGEPRPCPQCGEDVAAGARFCPRCGARQDDREEAE